MMKFQVHRTSEHDDTVPPCEGAVMVSAPNDWTNTMWLVELSTLDDLLAFAEKHGKLVLAPPSAGIINTLDNTWYIEIYDTYRD